LKVHIGEIVDTVRLRGDRYIIERRGKPVAAVVPVEVEEAYARNRQALFEIMERAAQYNRGIPQKKIDAAIDEAVREVRQARRAKGQGKVPNGKVT
ncbi:type II toxin-antitoxin system prevent-host-death family antitoxin, partial [Candidatus Sumerlaeota bacterium]|nr:type II toxin-antitoxin system prevent-host-death family antitoxin [Candidatus Sumerlaeota bacterium]